MKKSVIYYLGLVIGAVLFCIGGFVLKGESVSAISGIFIGIGSGVFGLCTGEIVKTNLINKDPKYKKKLDIEMKDERNLYISNKAKAKAYDYMIYAFGILAMIYALIDADMKIILLLAFAYLSVVVVNIFYINKYSKEL